MSKVRYYRIEMSIFASMDKIAHDHHCRRMEWTVYRLDASALERLNCKY